MRESRMGNINISTSKSATEFGSINGSVIEFEFEFNNSNGIEGTVVRVCLLAVRDTGDASVDVALVQRLLDFRCQVDHLDGAAPVVVAGLDQSVDQFLGSGEFHHGDTLHVDHDGFGGLVASLDLLDHVVDFEHGQKVDGSVELPDGVLGGVLGGGVDRNHLGVVAVGKGGFGAGGGRGRGHGVHATAVQGHRELASAAGFPDHGVGGGGRRLLLLAGGQLDQFKGLHLAVRLGRLDLGLGGGGVVGVGLVGVHSNGGDAADSDALRESHRNHAGNGGGKGNDVRFLDRVAVLEFGGVEHSHSGGDENAAQRGHGNHGNGGGHKDDRRKDKPGLDEGGETRVGVEAGVQRGSSNDRGGGHSHEHGRTNVSESLSDEFLVGVVLVGSLLHFFQGGATEQGFDGGHAVDQKGSCRDRGNGVHAGKHRDTKLEGFQTGRNAANERDVQSKGVGCHRGTSNGHERRGHLGVDLGKHEHGGRGSNRQGSGGRIGVCGKVLADESQQLDGVQSGGGHHAQCLWQLVGKNEGPDTGGKSGNDTDRAELGHHTQLGCTGC
mmetsp:Transcript_16453/g.35826  ORF Transcript_16453/g.35826 Transcript_16453/m.35826 type:complete len:552 (-) Transcript_16453:616-2271(-)